MQNKKLPTEHALVVGGTSGIGLAVVYYLLENGCSHISVLGLEDHELPKSDKIEYIHFNFMCDDFSIFDNFNDISALFITAGFGRVAFFKDLSEAEIQKLIKVNEESIIRIIKHFYNQLLDNKDFYCGVMGSISGLINSPLFSVYGATKAAVCSFISSVNAELEYNNSPNRILNSSPGNIKGSRFEGADNTNVNMLYNFASEFTRRAFCRELLYIPECENIYANVIKRSHDNTQKYGLESIQYKIDNHRLPDKGKPQIKIGYLSGTFDLFHVGHLNLLKKAKHYCDYLVVGIHKDASHKGKQTFIPFEERKAIVSSIKYVDEAIMSCPEDVDIYKKGIVKYDFLFVGSDYKGTERFNNYEKYFEDKNVQIIYFPYTQGTSSAEIREAILKLGE